MEFCCKRNIDENMKNKMVKIIKDSFEQNSQRKPCLVRNNLKKLYPSKDWNVI